MVRCRKNRFRDFTYAWTQIVRDDVLSGQLWTTILQTSTGRAHMVRGSDGKVCGKRLRNAAGYFDRPSDAGGDAGRCVVSAWASTSNPAEKLPTIAVVVARPVRYRISLLDEQASPGCTQAYHPRLSFRFPIPTTTISATFGSTRRRSASLQQARATWQAGVVNGHVFPITFTLYFNSRGFVTDWAAEGTVRNLFSKASYIASGTYQNVKQLDASPITGWPPH